MQTKIFIGSDHAGLNLKSIITNHLTNKGFEVIDLGTHSTESCDYPTIAHSVAKKVTENNAKGILICGTGVGMSIAANKNKGIRAAVVSDTCSAKLSRLHNDSNILCLGERIIGQELAKDIVEIWINTEFINEERHQRRIAMIEN